MIDLCESDLWPPSSFVSYFLYKVCNPESVLNRKKCYFKDDALLNQENVCDSRRIYSNIDNFVVLKISADSVHFFLECFIFLKLEMLI